MQTDQLLSVLTQIGSISPLLQENILSLLKEEKFEKRAILLKEGKICRRIYFITEGFCRAYYKNEDKEYTTWFMGENDIMISVFSFFTQQASFETIEALEDTIVYSITWEQLQNLYLEFPEFNLFGRIITENYYMKSEERAIALRTLTAKERYELLINKYPQVLQKASLGQIASHLGISQETLSRIRAK